MPTLWVDRRTGSVELIPALRKQNIDAQKATLDSADFMFTGHGPGGDCEFGVERKTLSDFVDSARTGRLYGISTETHESQLDRMLKTYEFCWLLLEGSYRTDRAHRLVQDVGPRGARIIPGGFSEDALNKSLLSLDLRGGLRVWPTRSEAASVRWLVSLFRSHTDKKWEQHTTLRTVQRQESIKPVSTFRDMVMRIPGIGFAASKAVEKVCGATSVEAWGDPHPSLVRLVNMTLADWENLDVPDSDGKTRKLGTAKAIKILDHVRRLR